MKITPLFDKVVLKPYVKEETSKGGILLSCVKDDKSQIAKVVAVGEGGSYDGKVCDMKVRVDDKVLYSKYAGAECEIEGERFIVVRQSDILAILS